MTDLALVTGATGFVGSALCRKLLDTGVHVRALHRPTSNLQALRELSVEWFEGDILDAHRMVEACHGVRWVYHAASQSAYWRKPGPVAASAVDGTRNLGEAALTTHVERLVFTSSIAAMGVPEQDELLTEDHAFNLPESRFPYGAAKYQAEVSLQHLIKRGLDAVIVNPTIILGPGDINRISGSMVLEAARGLGFFYLDGGENYVHIGDVVQGHLAAANTGECGARYILGGENLSHFKAFSILNQVVGRRPPWLHVPRELVPLAAWLIGRISVRLQLPFDANQLRMSQHELYCDVEPARQALGLGKPTPFRQAVQDTYDWYRREGFLN